MGMKDFNLQASLNSIWTDASLTALSGAYDQTKTNLVNRVTQRLLSGMTVNCLGISPAQFFSTQDLSGSPNPVAHGYTIEPVYPNLVQKIFIPLTPAAASIPVAYFQYNIQTDVYTYMGKLTLTLNTATVHTVRAIKVDDNSAGTTGWSIHLLTTNATVANGGYFYTPNVAAADFTVGGGTVIPSATTGNTQATKAVFWMQETGGTNNLQIGLGMAIDVATKSIYIGQATTSTIFYKFVYNTTITTVSAAGVTSDPYIFKTGANAQFGTALQTNNMLLAVPKSSQSNALVGQKCIYLSSATFGFHFLVSDLSSGSTTTPSQVTWNKLGTGTDYAAVTWAQAIWSNVLDIEVNYSSTSGVFMMKRSIMNDANMSIFGHSDAIYGEIAGTKHPEGFPGLAVGGIFEGSGVIYVGSTTVGQRGLYTLPIASSRYFANTYKGVVGPSYIITPVVSINCAQALALAIQGEFSTSGRPIIEFRTASFSSFLLTDTWTAAPINNILSTVGGLANISQVQLRISFSALGDYNSNAMMVNDLILAYTGKLDNSDNWRLRLDNFSLNGASPVQVGAKQVAAYAAGVQTIYFNYYDSGLNLIKQVNTSTHYAQMYKSTDGGTTLVAMTGPNDYTNSGGGTTVIVHRDPSPSAGINVVAVRDVSY